MCLDVAFGEKMLKKAKYRRFVEEFVADEGVSVDQNETVSIDQNETVSVDQNEISMINNINTETENNVFKWPHEAILLLVEEFRKRTDDFYSGRISQKKNWQNIAEALIKKNHQVTGPQCQSKFGSLKRTYKSMKDHNGKSGNGTRTWAYFDLLDGLIGSKPCISSVATASSSGKRINSEPEYSSVLTVNSNNYDQPRKKLNQMPSADKVIFAIEENRKISEESREKRHVEKIEQKKEALGLLARIVAVLEKKT